MELKQEIHTWNQFCDKWGKGCGSSLCSRAKCIVLGRGMYPAEVLFVGEAPGESEDALGIPFIGPAGEIIDGIIADSMKYEGYSYFMTNVVGCIPHDETGNKANEPKQLDIDQCSKRLQDTINLVKPKIIICVGKIAEKEITRSGKHTLRLSPDCRIGTIVHPAAIIRMPYVNQPLAIKKQIATIQSLVHLMRTKK